MKLEQKDRDLLFKFFSDQGKWIKNNDLTNFENLGELEKRFLVFMKQEDCKNNEICIYFYATIQKEKERSKKSTDLIKKTSKKKVKLNYKPIVKPATNNMVIGLWIDLAKTIPIDSFNAHNNAIGNAIRQKCKRNLIERQHTREDFK